MTERSERVTDETMGQRVRRLRIERGWTQKQLAEKIGASDSFVCHLETGRNPTLHWRTIRQLSGAFGVTPSEMAGEEADPADPFFVLRRLFARLDEGDATTWTEAQWRAWGDAMQAMAYLEGSAAAR